MSGSVSRSGEGWQFVIDAGPDAHGRRRQHRRRGFATKKLAQAAMVEAQNAALHGELVSCGRRTVAGVPRAVARRGAVVRRDSMRVEHPRLGVVARFSRGVRHRG